MGYITSKNILKHVQTPSKNLPRYTHISSNYPQNIPPKYHKFPKVFPFFRSGDDIFSIQNDQTSLGTHSKTLYAQILILVNLIVVTFLVFP